MQRSSLPGSSPNPALHDNAGAAHGDGRWFRQPVVWVGALILVASLIGCIVTVVVALRDADVPVETAGDRVMRVPSTR